MYFHIRDELITMRNRNEYFDATYCVSKDSNDLVIGYSVTHKNDSFKKSVGRKLAEERMNFVKSVGNNNAYYIDLGFSKGHEFRKHPVIEQTKDSIIKRVAEILKIDKCNVRIHCDYKGNKVISFFEYNKDS